jgi:hypothetical protein
MFTTEACTDCLIAIVNGDFPEDEARTAEIVRGVEAWDGFILTFGDSEGHFSWRDCDVCGTRFGGTRFDMVPVEI